MTRNNSAPALDRPWRRPGAVRYGVHRLGTVLRPPITIYSPGAGTVVVRRDLPVVTRDGTVLRVNLHLPPGNGPFPVLLSAHPYRKDNVPRKRLRGRGHRIPLQFRMLRQTGPISISELTGWEAPDPAWWTARGYAVLNADLRGAGTSGGVGSLLSDQEGQDVADLVEWAGAAPWSTGAVGLIGVSYLALSQWKAAAQHPPSLRAIVAWEGFTDAYRDLVRPGGIEEAGFVALWSWGLRHARLAYSIGAESRRRPLRDEWWQALVPALSRITVPALICGSFSDNNLHGRGSFRGYEQISATDKHLYTHRGGKWATFYSDEARAVQLAFLDRHLRAGPSANAPPAADTGSPAGVLPSVRLEVRESGTVVAGVRAESRWPLEPTPDWTALYLTGTACPGAAAATGSIPSTPARRGVRFGWTVPTDTELTGPMALRLFVSVSGAMTSICSSASRNGDGKRYVPFEGSYGFGRDRVTTGWLKSVAAPARQEQFPALRPGADLDRPRAAGSGQVVQADIAARAVVDAVPCRDRLRLVVAGRWLWRRNPLTGQLPAAYRRAPRAICMLHWGPDRPARLLVPVIGTSAP